MKYLARTNTQSKGAGLEWLQRLFTNTAAHSALLQRARFSITAKAERKEEGGGGTDRRGSGRETANVRLKEDEEEKERLS